MITMKDWLEAVQYKITEGDNYGWKCYGDNAHTLSCWNGIHDEGGWSASMIFDTKDQTVYEVDVCDYTNNRAYRLINPAFKKSYLREAKSRLGDNNHDQAWDDVAYVDLEVEEDFLEKATAIIAGEKYDARIQVPVDLTDEEMLMLFKMAHEQDITLNTLVENLLKKYLDIVEKNGHNDL